MAAAEPDDADLPAAPPGLRRGIHPRAAADLLPLVYEELRELARRRLAHELAGHTLQATALVHEAYLRLIGPAQQGDELSDRNAKAAGDQRRPRWDGRGHFFAAAAEAMRRILVEAARRRQCLKRGGNVNREERELDAVADRLLDGRDAHLAGTVRHAAGSRAGSVEDG